ncbi:distal membrane-arm assembly complex protein 2 isoform X5 [Hirundo rustica]|uniref:distal membrane-arm assembly complex protein 2 isoform X5 n=1 Tax=Hirundo rustica TaxID=43150 RepID=UPI0026712C75|nr:distal membrane-arm assembly complex protein 2 isoform X5 [Hirundo rustica]
MAALRAVRGSRGAPALRPPPGQRRGSSGGLRAHLGRWGQHLEAAAGWAERWRLRNLNAPRPTLRLTPDIAAAEFTLSCGGGVSVPGTPGTPGSLGLSPPVRLGPGPAPRLQRHPAAPGAGPVPPGERERPGGAAPPQVSERGLAALHHLSSLRSLDLSGIPVPSPGRFRALLEAALPGCRILGLEEPRE